MSSKKEKNVARLIDIRRNATGKIEIWIDLEHSKKDWLITLEDTSKNRAFFYEATWSYIKQGKIDNQLKEIKDKF